MNEIEYLRERIEAERSRCAEVRGLLAAALDAPLARETSASFCATCAEYLLLLSPRTFSRHQAQCEVLRARMRAGDLAGAHAVRDLESASAMMRRTDEQLEAAFAAYREGHATADQFLASCTAYLESLARLPRQSWAIVDALLKSWCSVSDWRRISFLDADAILAERTAHARVLTGVPAGVRLQRAAAGP